MGAVTSSEALKQPFASHVISLMRFEFSYERFTETYSVGLKHGTWSQTLQQ